MTRVFLIRPACLFMTASLCFGLPGALAQGPKVANSYLTRVEQVRVQITSVNDEFPNQGVLELKGDCDLCNQSLKFDDGTRVITPFYRGEMDEDVMEDQQFAYATVLLNTFSGEVLEINYMPVEY